MDIKAENGDVLKINVDVQKATFNVQVNNGPTAKLTLATVVKVLPALSQAKEALEEAAINKRKSRLDDLRQLVVDTQKEIEVLEKL